MRFETNYINALLEGNLSLQGYNHFLKVIAYYVNKNNWPLTIIVSSSGKRHWELTDFEELCQAYFEWMLSKNKLRYVSKVPIEYRSFYFLQLLISFISEKVNETQSKSGVSFNIFKKHTLDVLDAEFIKLKLGDDLYWYSANVDEFKQLSLDSIKDQIRYLPRIRVTESNIRIKPLIKGVLNQIFDVCEQPVEQSMLVGLCYGLFDQSHFGQPVYENNLVNNLNSTQAQDKKIDAAVYNVVEGLTANDCKIFLKYLFSQKSPSMDDLSNLHKLPKSTIHYKISTFKKKIQSAYVPENQHDGEAFVKKIYEALDKIATT